MPHILTFDLGTTYFKACLFDEAGRLRSLARRPSPTHEPQPRRREIEPAAFIDLVAELVYELRAGDPAAFADTAAISFSTQTNSFLLLDEDDRPLTPIIVWNDGRAEDEFDASALASGNLREETGVPALGPSFAVAKLQWLRRQQPEVWRRASRFLLIGDYLTWWLTGRHTTEAGAAGLTGLLDIHTLAWRDPLRAALDLANISLPEVRYAGSDVGSLRPEACNRLSLPPTCRCVLGCLDQYAGAIGAGNVEPGGLSETTGTVLATVALSERFAADLPPTVFQGPAWERGLWWRMSFGSASANLLEALRRGEPDGPSFETLSAEAAATPAGAEGLRLNPAASAASERPIFVGMEVRHGRGHRVRALFEGVAEALRDQVGDVAGPSDAATPVLAAGGAARSSAWLQIKADILGTPMVPTNCDEPTSRGAAILAIASLNGWRIRDTARRVAPAAPPVTPTRR